MIIVDPVVLGDVPFTRASPKWVYDRTGTLVEVPANTLGVTYDPADLSKAPWALIESAATNGVRNNTMQGGTVGQLGAGGVMPNAWQVGSNIGIAFSLIGKGNEFGIEYIDVRIFGNATGIGFAGIYFDGTTAIPAAAGDNLVTSVFCIHAGGSRNNVDSVQVCLDENSSTPSYVTGSSTGINLDRQTWNANCRAVHSRVVTNPAVAFASPHIKLFNKGAGPLDIMLRIGLPQIERDRLTSPIKTSGSAVTRAADVVGAGAGLVYSNVPMVESPYNVATTYAKDAAVYDPTTKIVYWSMVAGNVGKALSDPAFWNKRTAINRWAMFDDRNSTQTSNPEEIVSVFSAQAITQGLFAGAMDASEVRVSMTHPTRGLVFSETKSLVLPRSGSSFFGWCFNRLRLRTWFLTLKLPVFANALVTVTIKKPGGVPKCGMCLLGPTVDVGLSLMGLSTELKDYSTTTFFTDGSSSTVERGFSKKMSVDISVESDRVENDLIKRRQKTLVFLGSTMRGDTMLVGRFSSLRKVIDSFPRSKMALQIDGVLSQ
jgi:hypothetical protein